MNMPACTLFNEQNKGPRLLGPVVQKSINANPRLKINQEVYFSTPIAVRR